MEVFLDVWVENNTTGERKKCNEATYTFVAVDQIGNPINVPPLVPKRKKKNDGSTGRFAAGNWLSSWPENETRRSRGIEGALLNQRVTNRKEVTNRSRRLPIPLFVHSQKIHNSL
jgi:acyl-CoA hydrolase